MELKFVAKGPIFTAACMKLSRMIPISSNGNPTAKPLRSLQKVNSLVHLTSVCYIYKVKEFLFTQLVDSFFSFSLLQTLADGGSEN